jgi:hypothetical protein
MIVVTFVGTNGISDRIDTSTTRNASTPRAIPGIVDVNSDQEAGGLADNPEFSD